MSSRRPTPEQEVAVAAFRRGDDLVLQAGAGTGKTTTLTMLGNATRWQGRYLEFNKSIAAETERKFGGNVRCATAHKLAFNVVGRQFVERLDRPRMSTVKLAQLLGITMEVTIGARELKAGDVVLDRAGNGAAVLLFRRRRPGPPARALAERHRQRARARSARRPRAAGR
ncbi:hypothetical protein [Amycolatopsis sp. EV170708-02-1]|uniref:hypothetical protein n=1 Tax=Amycolatopsis sp. EV170708-02-1 TaxID=2919322 RepID=UPI001F0C2AEB|nr:hypothetical protein [Amycolatopsis sp. EV170708-02-1]UMO99958.1 hypothetical protein MJQ72_25990 [Amycolatopsis sp. EV170708-02-1]